MGTDQEKFNNMIYDYYEQNTDLLEREDELLIDLAAKYAAFVSDYITYYLDDGVYTLTPLGEAYAKQIQQEKARLDFLQEKYNDFTISADELYELKELKERYE